MKVDIYDTINCTVNNQLQRYNHIFESLNDPLHLPRSFSSRRSFFQRFIIPLIIRYYDINSAIHLTLTLLLFNQVLIDY